MGKFVTNFNDAWSSKTSLLIYQVQWIVYLQGRAILLIKEYNIKQYYQKQHEGVGKTQPASWQLF